MATAVPAWRVLDFADPQEGWANEHQRAGENVAGDAAIAAIDAVASWLH